MLVSNLHVQDSPPNKELSAPEVSSTKVDELYKRSLFPAPPGSLSSLHHVALPVASA